MSITGTLGQHLEQEGYVGVVFFDGPELPGEKADVEFVHGSCVGEGRRPECHDCGGIPGG